MRGTLEAPEHTLDEKKCPSSPGEVKGSGKKTEKEKFVHVSWLNMGARGRGKNLGLKIFDGGGG